MAESNTLRNIYSLIREGFAKGTAFKKMAKKKKPKGGIGLGDTPAARAIKKHNKDLKDALEF